MDVELFVEHNDVAAPGMQLHLLDAPPPDERDGSSLAVDIAGPIPDGAQTPTVGRNPALDLPTAVRLVPVERRDGHLTLITVLDSTRAVSTLPSLVPFLERHGTWHATVGQDVVVILAALVDRLELFAGFDEPWLCTAPPAVGKPEHLRITSDRPLPAKRPNSPRGCARPHAWPDSATATACTSSPSTRRSRRLGARGARRPDREPAHGAGTLIPMQKTG